MQIKKVHWGPNWFYAVFLRKIWAKIIKPIFNLFPEKYLGFCGPSHIVHCILLKPRLGGGDTRSLSASIISMLEEEIKMGQCGTKPTSVWWCCLCFVWPQFLFEFHTVFSSFTQRILYWYYVGDLASII